MSRLTNYSREGITKAVLQHRFSDAATSLVADRAAFAMRVYADIYSEAERRKMKALPNGWLPEQTHIHVQFGGGSGYAQINFNGAGFDLPSVLKQPIEIIMLRVPSAHCRGCVKLYEIGSELATANDELKARLTDLKREISIAENQVTSALNSTASTARLVEIWPEIEPFVRKYEDKPHQLPALPTAQLNAMLKLPVSEAAL